MCALNKCLLFHSLVWLHKLCYLDINQENKKIAEPELKKVIRQNFASLDFREFGIFPLLTLLVQKFHYRNSPISEYQVLTKSNYVCFDHYVCTLLCILMQLHFLCTNMMAQIIWSTRRIVKVLLDIQ